MKISIVIPAHNEEENVRVLYDELVGVLKSIGHEYRIIFIDDGSTDGTFRILEEISGSDKRVTVIQLSRKFGKTAAMCAGFEQCDGDVVVTLDADRQNDPADIPKFLDRLAEGYDVVSGWRKRRNDPFLRSIVSAIANKIIARITGVKIHDNGCMLRAIRDEYVRGLLMYGEMHRFFTTLLYWRGAKITEEVVNHRPRVAGKSKYGFERVLKVVFDLFVVKFLMSFSDKPVYFFGSLGMISFSSALFVVAYLIYDKFMYGQYMIQSPLLLLAAMLVIVSTQLILMGLLAELIVRVFYTSGKIDQYKVRTIINGQKQKSTAT